jgi:SAM-dependent methyltransferase
VLALEAEKHTGPEGEVVALDNNEGMLAVARRKSSAIEWRQGSAESLPFQDGRFDAVVSQFGLMFFEDKRQAVDEMARVLEPGGRLAVAVWGKLADTPGYAAVTRILGQLFGQETADALRAPYSLGDEGLLMSLFHVDGLKDVKITTLQGKAVFPSLHSWMYTDVKGWTLADVLDDEQFGQLLRSAEEKLTEFVDANGQVSFDAPAHIVSATKTLIETAV